MHKALFVILLKLACPWLANPEINRHAGYIANTVNSDIDAGVMLITTGAIETGYRKGWERCECKDNECDNGNALGTYQLQYYWRIGLTNAQVCEDSRLQTSIASKALISMRKQYGSSYEALRLYVGRAASNSDVRIAPRHKLYQQLTDVAARYPKG